MIDVEEVARCISISFSSGKGSLGWKFEFMRGWMGNELVDVFLLVFFSAQL